MHSNTGNTKSYRHDQQQYPVVGAGVNSYLSSQLSGGSSDILGASPSYLNGESGSGSGFGFSTNTRR
jgi:hypothetical protein